MKTIRILLGALFLFFLAFVNTYAQTFTLKTTEFREMYFNCNNQPEVISGAFSVHYIVRINKDICFEWGKEKYLCGEAVSQTTGEVFRVNHKVKEDPFIPGTIFHRTFHFNLVGDHGTHLIVSVTLENDFTGTELITTLVRFKSKCL